MTNNLAPEISNIRSEAKLDLQEPLPVVLNAPAETRNIALALLSVLAVIYTLHWARDVFIPLMLGVMISYALSPLVNIMQKAWIPRVIGAGLLLLGMAGAVGGLVYSLSDDAAKLIETLPNAAKKLRLILDKEHGLSIGPMEKVQQAATQLESAANETRPALPLFSDDVVRVQVEKPKFDVTKFLWQGTLGAAGFVGQTGIVLFLAYFLLVSGDAFRRKLVKISGSRLSRKKITLHVLDDINGQIQRYMLVQVFTSILVGIMTWLAFLWIGLENAGILGVAAGVFNSIPYLGPVVVTGGTALVALLQFGTLEMALVAGGASLFITSLEGYFLTPWLTGRASRMSAAVVFISVLFWGWLWGVWGMLLGVPIILAVKAVCDQVDDFKPIGELLSD